MDGSCGRGMGISQQVATGTATVGTRSEGPRERRRKVPRALSGPVGYLFTAPALAIFAVFTIAPTIYTLYISLFNWNSLNVSRSRFRGLQNYQELFTESDFPTSALNSLYRN